MAITSADLVFFGPDGAQLVDGRLDQVFKSAPAASATDYAIIAIRNNHATLTLTGVKAWKTQTAGAAIAIGATASGAAITASTDPTTVAYSAPETAASGIALSNIGPGASVYLAIRRTIGTTTANPQTVTIHVNGTSAA